MSHHTGSVGFHDSDELMTDPPAKLTKRGLVLLEEIWILAGKPPKPEVKNEDDGTTKHMVAISKLASHHGTDAKRKSIAKVRSHLFDGGFLNMEEYQSAEDEMYGRGGIITEIGLSVRAYDALAEAGILKPQAPIVNLDLRFIVSNAIDQISAGSYKTARGAEKCAMKFSQEHDGRWRVVRTQFRIQGHRYLPALTEEIASFERGKKV